MARPREQGINTAARSLRQLRRFCHLINADKVFGTHRHDLKQSHSTRTKRKAIANIQQSCSDSPAIVNQMDGVFGTDSGASRWNILGDRTLSDAMPEVFAPPPVLLAEFLSEEGAATLRRSSPLAWAFMRARGLLVTPSRHHAGGDHAHTGATRRARGFGGRAKWIMRVLRKNVFDRFGRGGAARRKKR